MAQTTKKARRRSRAQETRPRKAAAPPSLEPGWWDRLPTSRQHGVCLVVLLVLGVLFAAPTLFSGKSLIGGDTVQWRAMAESSLAYEEEAGRHALWVPNAFGGMPAYMVSYPNRIPQLDTVATLLRGLFWPLSHFAFLLAGTYLLGFFLTRSPWSGVLAASAYGLTTYLAVILPAGHNTKFIALCFAPWLVLAFAYALRKPKLLSGLFFAIAFAVNLRAGHVQITYYFAFLMGVWWLVEAVGAVRHGRLGAFGRATGFLALGSVLGLLMVAQPYLIQAEYKAFTIRGAATGGEASGGLAWDYAMGWSQGWGELVTLAVADAYGGSALYWGPKTFTGGPHYVGGIVLLLAGLALWRVRRNAVWAFGIAAFLMTLFSLGEHFEGLNRLMFNVFPLFDAFRVPETWLSAVAFALAVLAGFGLAYAGRPEATAKAEGEKTRALYTAAGVAVGVALVLFLLKGVFFDFERPGEAQQVAQQLAANNNVSPDDPRVTQAAQQYLQGVEEERQAKFSGDALRTLVFLLLAGGLLVLYRRGTVPAWAMQAALALLVMIDLLGVDRRYFSEDDLTEAEVSEAEIPELGFDRFILDQRAAAGGPGRFRVLSLEGLPDRTARPSYFYESLSGYHGAKLRLYQDFLEHLLVDPATGQINENGLDLMGTRYVVARGRLPGDGRRLPGRADGPGRAGRTRTPCRGRSSSARPRWSRRPRRRGRGSAPKASTRSGRRSCPSRSLSRPRLSARTARPRSSSNASRPRRSSGGSAPTPRASWSPARFSIRPGGTPTSTAKGCRSTAPTTSCGPCRWRRASTRSRCGSSRAATRSASGFPASRPSSSTAARSGCSGWPGSAVGGTRGRRTSGVVRRPKKPHERGAPPDVRHDLDVRARRVGVAHNPPPTVKRLLFITYYFPPSGGPGVQRALKFAKYLPQFGWQPTVLTVRPEKAAYPDLDPTLAGEVPPDVRVERTGAWDPYALYARLQGKSKAETVGVGFLGEAEMDWKQRLARWVRANVFLPDARVGWVPFALRRGRALVEADPFDALLTTGPPHSAHLAGLLLARRYGLPWIADFRDPWTDIDYAEALPMTAPARRADAAMERAVLRGAGQVTAVSPQMARRLATRADVEPVVIQNGFDPADFQAPPPPPRPHFEVAYLGNMNDARNPQALWEALRQLGLPETMPDVRVRLVGNVDPVVLRSAREQGVADVVETAGYVPHDEAVRRMRASAVLLLVINRVPGADGIMTGKLYEYVASGRPVLGLGPPDGDAAVVLRGAGAGEMFDYGDAAGVAAFLQRHHAAWKGGTPRPGAGKTAAERYSRRGQTGQLAQLLDALTSSDAGTSDVRSTSRSASPARP